MFYHDKCSLDWPYRSRDITPSMKRFRRQKNAIWHFLPTVMNFEANEDSFNKFSLIRIAPTIINQSIFLQHSTTLTTTDV